MKPTPATPISQAVAAFLAELERTGKTEATLRNYRADLSALLRSAGSSAPTRALARVARKHLDELQLAERSWNRHLSTLRRFCDYLVSTRSLLVNPVRSIARAAVSFEPVRPAGAAEVGELLNRVERLRDRALITLLWHCGLRVSEALALRVGDVSLDQEMVVVRHGVRRRIRLMSAAKTVLDDYLRRREAHPKEPLFATHDGRPLSYAGAHRLFRRYAGETGLTMQRLRASAAVSAFSLGASLAEVQSMLGHLHAASTARYQLGHQFNLSTPRSRKTKP